MNSTNPVRWADGWWCSSSTASSAPSPNGSRIEANDTPAAIRTRPRTSANSIS
jgi:hypothetical protein